MKTKVTISVAKYVLKQTAVKHVITVINEKRLLNF